MKKILLLVLLLPVHFCIGQSISLVKDINHGAADSYPSFWGTESDGTRFCFWADDGTPNVNQLWITDGTTAGTHMVCSLPVTFHQTVIDPVYFAGKWYFTASEGVNGEELWVTDGTTCSLVKDINTGVGDSYIYDIAIYNNELYFQAFNGTSDNLWKSDGTASGTVVVDNAYELQGSQLMEYNSKLYFLGKVSTTNSSGLLVTDGSSIQMVKEFSSTGNGFIRALTPTSIGLFFIADDGVNGRELWISDGTTIGTRLVKDIDPSGSGIQQQLHMTFFNGEIYFGADDGVSGNELWRSDGTTLGTVIVKEINPNGDSFYLGDFRGIVYNGNLYFSASVNLSDFEVWKTDGTTAGTEILKEINTNGTAYPYGLFVFNNQLLFTADNGSNGHELWTSDGTTNGTTMIEDLNPGPGIGIDNLAFMVVNNKLLFPASNGTTGFELYEYNSTSTSVTGSVKPASIHLYPNPASSSLTLSADRRDMRLAIYNTQGIMVKDCSSIQDKDLINIEDLDKGLYLVHVYYQDGSSEQVKVVKE